MAVDHGLHEGEAQADALFLGLARLREAREALEQPLLVLHADAIALVTHTAARPPFDWRGLWLRILPPVFGFGSVSARSGRFFETTARTWFSEVKRPAGVSGRNDLMGMLGVSVGAL